jgi:DNA (cytosine-5)-methyltransferase 1
VAIFFYLHFFFAIWLNAFGRGHMSPRSTPEKLTAVELFAGVGGFRLGLERTGAWQVAWSNQWEPGAKSQFASECYVSHFGDKGHVCEDIEKVLDHLEIGAPVRDELFQQIPPIPRHDLLVGGFPCQDYSVAKPLNQAEGIKGQKGVLWWQIYRIIERHNPRFVLLENVDRLLKSPGRQRGRDFAIILSCFRDLGYAVDWRVINAADYGFPQRRRRVFILAQRTKHIDPSSSPVNRILRDGILAKAFPVAAVNVFPEFQNALVCGFNLPGDPHEVSLKFGLGQDKSDFANAGFMSDGIVWTMDVEPLGSERPHTLGEIVKKTRQKDVPEGFFVPEGQLDTWRYLKGAKNEPRVHKKSGAAYIYTEGALPFPDPLDRPARTILTAEGGSSPSRFKHIIQLPDGRFRRLIPEELEELNGFPRGWTATGMSGIKRAFCMGNALVVGVVERIGRAIAEDVGLTRPKKPSAAKAAP